MLVALENMQELCESDLKTMSGFVLCFDVNPVYIKYDYNYV